MDDWNSLVEASIDSIRADVLTKEVHIELTSAWEGKRKVQIVATGVVDFLVNEMRLSNIIDRVSRFDSISAKEAEDEIARRVFFLMRGQEPKSSDLTWPELHTKVAQIREGDLVLLEVEPVYGATILILATSLELVFVPTTV